MECPLGHVPPHQPERPKVGSKNYFARASGTISKFPAEAVGTKSTAQQPTRLMAAQKSSARDVLRRHVGEKNIALTRLCAYLMPISGKPEIGVSFRFAALARDTRPHDHPLTTV
jgi:hypothetical protein